MRQLVIESPGRVVVADVPVPSPAAGEALVRTRVAGICGSDLHCLAGEHPFVSLPVVPGHEVAGVVEALGEGVEGVSLGDRVLVEPTLVCGRCPRCTSGRYNLCERLAVLGCQTTGAMAEMFTVPAGRLHRIPDDLDDTLAALVEPLATATLERGAEAFDAARRGGEVKVQLRVGG